MNRLFILISPAFFVILISELVLFLITPIPTKPYFLREQIKNDEHLSPGQAYQYVLQNLDTFTQKGSLLGVFFHGSRDKKQVALTFDADMTYGMVQMLQRKIVKSFYDERLIRILKETNTPATLFLSGLWVEQYPEQTKKLAEDSLFELGSHSYSHKAYATPCYNLEKISDKDKVADIGSSQYLLEKYTNKKTDLFRFPGGCFGPNDVSLLRTAGAKAIAWDVVADDGFNNNSEAIVSKVVNSVKNGSIIVMHMNGYPNEPVDFIAVPKIIERLKKKGFEFVTVSRLFKWDIMSFRSL